MVFSFGCESSLAASELTFSILVILWADNSAAIDNSDKATRAVPPGLFEKLPMVDRSYHLSFGCKNFLKTKACRCGLFTIGPQASFHNQLILWVLFPEVFLLETQF
jgi:hypothetical protein